MQLLREGKSFSGRERNCVFLNNGQSQFANISVVSGADFPDDGRAVASVDWDQDGDLDLWIHNRTGPRLRFLKNQARENQAEAANFVAIRLRGVQCNRDAIGARVIIRRIHSTRKDALPPLMQTVYAGDGYLSQSSKWLHFGLGESSEIESIRVRWPDGSQEELRSIPAGRRFRIVQGTGKATEVVPTRDMPTFSPTSQIVHEPDSTVRIIFSNPVPLPSLDTYSSSQRTPESKQTINANEQSLLIVLWASWCPNCIRELEQISLHQRSIDAAKLGVIAVNIDALTTTQTGSDGKVRDVLQQVDFPFTNRFAALDLMEKLQVTQRVVLNRPLPPAVPLILLVNRHNELTALYQGGQAIETILQDAADSTKDILQRRELSTPFAGTWTTPPNILLMRPIANVFREAGFRDDYERFLQLDRLRLQRLQENVATDGHRRELEVRFADDSFDLAYSLLETGRAEESLEYFRQGLAGLPESAQGHLHFGRALQATKNVDQALTEYQTALRLDPTLYLARFQLAVYKVAAGQLEDARADFQRVVEQKPSHAEAWTNLGIVFARLKQSEQAIAALEKAVDLDPSGVQAWMTLGAQLAGRRDFRQAANCFRRVTELNPKLPHGFAALGQALVKLKEDENAAPILQQAILLNPRDSGSRLQLSWLQSTSPIDSVRDGQAAFKTATRLAKLTQNRDPRVLDLLAAALAENGEYERAASTARRAIDLTPRGHPIRSALEARVELYKSGKPFRSYSVSTNP